MLLDVLKVNKTVPVYPPDGVKVIVSVPELPWVTFSVVGVAVNAMLPVPELLPPIFTCATPVESAKVESPAY